MNADPPPSEPETSASARTWAALAALCALLGVGLAGLGQAEFLSATYLGQGWGGALAAWLASAAALACCLICTARLSSLPPRTESPEQGWALALAIACASLGPLLALTLAPPLGRASWESLVLPGELKRLSRESPPPGLRAAGLDSGVFVLCEVSGAFGSARGVALHLAGEPLQAAHLPAGFELEESAGRPDLAYVRERD